MPARRTFLAFVAALPFIGAEASAKHKKHKKPAPPPPPPPPPAPPRQSVLLNGVAPRVTEPFTMVEGRYIATCSITATERTNFIAWLYGPGEIFTKDLLVNEIPEAPGSYHYQHVIQIEDTGSHFLEVQKAGGSWTVAIDPA